MAAAATVTVAGTVTADVLLLVSATTEPPLGAAADSVTVHVVDVEAASVVLVHCSEPGVTDGAVMLSATLLLAPFSVAVIVGV